MSPCAGSTAVAPSGARAATATGTAWSCTVRLVVADAIVLDAAAADLFALLDRVDRAASRFRPDSALSIANARAGKPTPVPALLVDLVGAALDAARDTDGAVDPTLGLAMTRIGYDRDIATVRADEVATGDAPNELVEGPSPTAAVGAITGAFRGRWPEVRLHRGAGLLTVPPGTALDLGATAKAWTADHAARELAARYGTAVLVELGGDLAIAGGHGHEWLVRVGERSDAPDADGQVVTLTRGGLATSTTTVRAWRHDGQRVHHLIDPRTGRSAAGPWRTASVHADSALAANVASTAAIVHGERALGWLAARGLAARLVAQDGAIVTTSGWPSLVDEDRP